MLSRLENDENEDRVVGGSGDTDATGTEVPDGVEDSAKASDAEKDIDNGSHQYDIGPCPLQHRVETLTKSCEAESESVAGTGAFQWILRIAGLTFVILRRAFGKTLKTFPKIAKSKYSQFLIWA